jgi:transposase InsO family protein
MAIAFRTPPRGCIHQTDRGSQYCSHDYQKILRQHGFKVSMSEKGNCYDNAAVETFFKTIKAELIWRHPWETRRKAEISDLRIHQRVLQSAPPTLSIRLEKPGRF